MKKTSHTLKGVYYSGIRPVGVQAKLTVSRGQTVLTGKDVSETYETARLSVSPGVGQAPRFIALPDDGQFLCRNHPLLKWLPQSIRSESVVSWLEEHVSVAVSSVIIIAALLLCGYFYGLPVAAEKIALRIPVETEKALGDETMTWLDDNNWFTEPHIEAERQDNIRRKFTQMAMGLEMQPHMQLVFRCSEMLGPNAIALPGGKIVITDQMINKAESDEEVLAILAHEMGHVENRHVLRQLLQSTVVGVAVASVTADAATVGTAVAGLPLVLLQTKYSRGFETEADQFAFDLLKEHDISPEAFANIMDRLDDNKINFMGFMSTHPGTSERINKAREASGNLSP